MTESAEPVQGAPDSERPRPPDDGNGSGPSRSDRAPDDRGQAPDDPAAPENAGGEEADTQERDRPAEVGVDPLASVIERNAFSQNSITVHGDFIGSAEGDGRRATVTTVDITGVAARLDGDFVEPPSFGPAVEAIESQRMALLFGGGCGNRVTATVALRRTGHEQIVELPGSMAAPDLVEAVQSVCRREGVGVLVDSVDTETLTALAGFRVRHLHGALPDGAAVVFTTRSPRHVATDRELPAIEGAPPDDEQMVELMAERGALDEDQRERCRAALALLPRPAGPARIAQLIALAPAMADPAELAATVDGQSQALDEWLAERPEARRLAALAAAACLDGLPSADFDEASEYLKILLEGELEPSAEPPRFGPREDLWPAGVARFGVGNAITHFGWQETEIVEICSPHRRDSVIAYLWSRLDGAFRRPFLEWLRELPASSSNRLAFAAARAAGTLFARDPLTIERELLRPWALDGSTGLRSAAGFALGVPVTIGADPTGARRLVAQWSRSNSAPLRAAAIAAYGGPLGIWDPSAAAPSRLWEMADMREDLQVLVDAALSAQFVGGREAGRARATTLALLGAAESRGDVLRAYAVLSMAYAELTGGSARARASLEALLGEAEAETFAGMAALLARAFDDKDGRESAQHALRSVLGATAAGWIGRDVVERLIREMKAGAAERGRLPRLGAQILQLLKAEDRKGGPLRDVARSLHETFYDKQEGGASSESE